MQQFEEVNCSQGSHLHDTKKEDTLRHLVRQE